MRDEGRSAPEFGGRGSEADAVGFSVCRTGEGFALSSGDACIVPARGDVDSFKRGNDEGKGGIKNIMVSTGQRVYSS